jgi:hypothetical protein
LLSESTTSQSEILPWEVVEAMTLIGAMDCGDGLLLAADREVTADGIRVPTKTKIRRTQNPPLAWAIAGDQGLGAQFDDWLQARTAKPFTPKDDMTPTPWDQLKLEAANRLNTLNGQRKLEVARAQEQVSRDYFAGLLLVGCVGGRFQVMEIDPRGLAGFATGQHPTFIGMVTREPMFALAGMRRALAKQGKELPNGVEALREVMVLAHELMPGIGEVEMVKVTKNGVADVPFMDWVDA